MSGKRQATSDLNHDNWDNDEEPEERGTFRTATEEELKNRVIKRAKRKIATGSDKDAADGGPGTKSVFSSFSGFGKPATTVGASSSPFSFLSKIPAIGAAASGVVSSSTTTNSSTPIFSYSSGSVATTTTAKSTENSTTSFSFGRSTDTVAQSPVKASSSAATGSSGFSEYHKKLSCLNQAVCEWIKTHVDKNPVCILSPIFKDYEKYLKEIEITDKNVEIKEIATTDVEKPSGSDVASSKFSISNSDNSASLNVKTSSSTTSEATAKTNGFNFPLKKPEDASSAKPSTTSGFSFGLNPSSTSSSSTTSSSFSFGNPTSDVSKPFSFKPGGTPFSFGNIKPPEVSGTTTVGDDANDEDEEPPKNEFKQVVEDDAVYSIKCKVFVKKDGNFVDKGVGTLYLKPVETSGKTQLLVRADTNLGNILVNLILNAAIPAQRMGKNNVMMVCLPTPDVDKPTSILLRVKTGEDADELLENIEKHKK